MIKLSVVIITYNEERNIGRCLGSVSKVADDIVVVDSFSTDKTESICKNHSVNFIQKTWEGYSATKNFANAQAKNDWVLSLDADEALSEELVKSIVDWKNTEKENPVKFNRLTNYCGKWVKHGGWYPDTKTRIFNRTSTKWQGEIHEELIFTDKNEILHLNGDCYHYSYYTKEEHLKQADKFTTIAARDLFSKNRSTSIFQIYLSPVVKFLRDYIFNLGFLDGKTGYNVARISASSTFMKYKKLHDLNLKNSRG